MALIAVLLVFGLTTIMIFKGYDPTIITAAVTATTLAAAELVRRIQESSESPPESNKKDPQGR